MIEDECVDERVPSTRAAHELTRPELEKWWLSCVFLMHCRAVRTKNHVHVDELVLLNEVEELLDIALAGVRLDPTSNLLGVHVQHLVHLVRLFTIDHSSHG